MLNLFFWGNWFIVEDYDPIAIAEKEFVQKKIPFIIRRYLPNKEYEDWALGDLEVLDWEKGKKEQKKKIIEGTMKMLFL